MVAWLLPVFKISIVPSPFRLLDTKANGEATNCFLGDISPSYDPVIFTLTDRYNDPVVKSTPARVAQEPSLALNTPFVTVLL